MICSWNPFARASWRSPTPLARVAEQARPGEAWKAIIETYLSSEMCGHPGRGCPLPALAPDLARVDMGMKAQVVAELVRYKDRIQPFMPGRRAADKERAFFVIFSTMTGTIAIARILPFPVRANVLAKTRDFLLRAF